MTPPSSSRICTSPRAFRCMHCHSAWSCGINTALKHNQCQWPWLCMSAGSAPRELWHCTFASLERNTGTGIHTLPLQSNSRAVQQSTRTLQWPAGACNTATFSHCLLVWVRSHWAALQEELPQNCALHCQQTQGEWGIASGWKVTLKN